MAVSQHEGNHGVIVSMKMADPRLSDLAHDFIILGHNVQFDNRKEAAAATPLLLSIKMIF